MHPEKEQDGTARKMIFALLRNFAVAIILAGKK